MVYPPQLPEVFFTAVALLGAIGGLEDHVVDPHIAFAGLLAPLRVPHAALFRVAPQPAILI